MKAQLIYSKYSQKPTQKVKRKHKHISVAESLEIHIEFAIRITEICKWMIGLMLCLGTPFVTVSMSMRVKCSWTGFSEDTDTYE